MFCAMRSILQTSLVNLDVKRGSLSLIIFLGSPYLQNTFLTNSPAISSAVTVSLHGMKSIALVQSWSVTVRIESYPWDGGSFVMKSTAIVSKGMASRVGKMGCSGAFVGRLLTSFLWQSAH